MTAHHSSLGRSRLVPNTLPCLALRPKYPGKYRAMGEVVTMTVASASLETSL